MLTREKARKIWVAIEREASGDQLEEQLKGYEKERELFYDYILHCIYSLPSEESDWMKCPVCGGKIA